MKEQSDGTETQSYLALVGGFGANIMVVRSRSTCFTSGTGRGPSVGVVRACRAFRAGSSRRGAGPIIVGASGARQTCCAGGGADAAAVRPRGTCRAGGNGGRSRVAVVGSLRAQCTSCRSSNRIGSCWATYTSR